MVIKMLNKLSFLKKYKFEFIFGGIALFSILLDQFLKYLILHFQPSYKLGILFIHLVHNTGAGFGIFQNGAFWLGLVSLCAAMLVLFNYSKIEKKYFPQIVFGLLLGGIVGNMIDRLLRGAVVDFIDLSFWPAFNIADACISVSVVLLIIYYWKKESLEQKDSKIKINK